MFKIANDLRWLGSGPRTGIHELILPANEPGSSIMPGKVNPTQAEAMLMVAIQVIASDVAITMGGAEGNFELNAFRPVLISNYLHSALILADVCDRFREFMIEGAELNQAKLRQDIDRSVMMVTALSPVIGYDQASVISHHAIDHDLTLKQAALANGVSEELFNRVVNPLALTRGGSADLLDDCGSQRVDKAGALRHIPEYGPLIGTADAAPGGKLLDGSGASVRAGRADAWCAGGRGLRRQSSLDHPEVAELHAAWRHVRLGGLLVR